MGGWWRWALVSPDGVAPHWMVGMSASGNLPLHFTIGSPRWSFVSDIAIFVLKRDVKLQLTNPGGPGKRAVNGCGVVVRMHKNFVAVCISVNECVTAIHVICSMMTPHLP